MTTSVVQKMYFVCRIPRATYVYKFPVFDIALLKLLGTKPRPYAYSPDASQPIIDPSGTSEDPSFRTNQQASSWDAALRVRG